MRAAWIIAVEELRRVVRDRIGLAFVVVLPVVIMVIIGATIGAAPRHTAIGVVDLDGSEDAERLIEALDDPDLLDVSRYDDVATLERDIRTRLISGGVAIPRGYGEVTGSTGEPATVRLLSDRTQSTSVSVGTIVTNVVARQAAHLGAADFVSSEVGGTPQENLDRVRSVEERVSVVGVQVDTVGRESLEADSQYAYTAPSNLVLFTFINTVTGAAALVESRRLGVTRRMLAAPVSVTSIVVGQGLSRFGIALLQSLLILGIGAVMFGVSWGDPVAVGVLAVLFAVLASSAGLLVATLAEDPDKVPAIAIPVSIALAMLGGCMWPLEVVPSWVRTLGHFTPHAWAMDAWIALIFEDGDLRAISGNLAVLGAIAAALLVTAVWRMRRSLTR